MEASRDTDVEPQSDVASRPQYRLNDVVTLNDGEGNVINGEIADYDAAEDVFFVDVDRPINGRYVVPLTRADIESMIVMHNGVAVEPLQVQEDAAAEAEEGEAFVSDLGSVGDVKEQGTAYEKKNSAFDNTTDTGETSNRGKQNDTATLQNTVSVGKDRNNSENINGIDEESADEGITNINKKDNEAEGDNEKESLHLQLETDKPSTEYEQGNVEGIQRQVYAVETLAEAGNSRAGVSSATSAGRSGREKESLLGDVARRSKGNETWIEDVHEIAGERIGNGQENEVYLSKDGKSVILAEESALGRVPKDAAGNPIYEQADSDTAWDAIVEQTEGDEAMAQAVADSMVADKKAALKKAEKAKSKGGVSIAEKIAAEKQRKAAIEAAAAELAIWQKIAGVSERRRAEREEAERKRMEANRAAQLAIEAEKAEDERRIKEAEDRLRAEEQAFIDSMEPLDAEEAIAMAFIRGKYGYPYKITPESWAKEMGGMRSERRELPVGLIASSANGGMSIAAIAQRLVEDDENGVFHAMDDNDVRGMIIEQLRNGAIGMRWLKERRQDIVDIQRRAREDEEYYWLNESYLEELYMSYDEYVDYEEHMADAAKEYLKNFDEAEYNSILAEDYENNKGYYDNREYYENRGFEESKSAAEGGGSSESSNLLSGTRVIEQGGISESGERDSRREAGNLVEVSGTSANVGGIAAESGIGRTPEGQIDIQQKESINAPLSANEVDEFGKPLVLAKDGSTTFGFVEAETGLTAAPIRLSLGENSKDKSGSRDGSYWNVNSAGIFKKKYSRRKPKVYTVPALGESTSTDTSEVDSGQIEGATAPAGDSSETSVGKDTNNSRISNEFGKKVSEKGGKDVSLQQSKVSSNGDKVEFTSGGQVLQPVSQGEHGTLPEENGGMEQTATRLRERIAADAGARESGLPREIQEIENRAARSYAKEQGLWLPYSEVMKLGRPTTSGNEHDLYLNAAEGVVYKVNNRMNTRSIPELLDRMALHNATFPNVPYSLVGFTSVSENGDVWPVFSQRYVPSARMATEAEIAGYMSELGFEPAGEARFSNGSIVAKDLRPRNVLVDTDGDVYVVDAEFEQAAEYAGEGEVYEQRVPVDSVAWIKDSTGTEGQLAEVEDNWMSKPQFQIIGEGASSDVSKSDEELYRSDEKTREGVSQRVISLSKVLHTTSETDGATLNVDAKIPQMFETASVEGENFERKGYGAYSDDELYRSSEAIAAEYPNWLEGTITSSGKHSTQVEGTRKTYNKVGDWIADNLGTDVEILDASSGMGYGTTDLRNRGFNIEDVEPYQSEERKEKNPATYSSYGAIDKQYDYIISNAVLNVIPDDWRAGLLHDMAQCLKPGGRMFINTRKTGEEKSIKDKIELDSPQEVLVKRNGVIASYQRFFTPQELKGWVESELGEGFSVEVANKQNSGTSGLAAVVVTKNNESPTDGRTSELGQPNSTKEIAPVANVTAKVSKNIQRANKLNEVNSRFNEELEAQINGTLAKGHIYELGMPSEILLSTGIPNLPIQLNSTKLEEKSTNYGHNYELSEVKDLVLALNNPIAVFEYGDKGKAQNIVVEIQHDGKNFVVGLSIKPNVNGRILEINSIRNVFPKNNAEWLNWIAQGKTLYLDKGKIQTLIDQQRTILADVDYLDLDYVAKVVENFENPKTISEEQAKRAAKKRFGRQLRKDVVRVATFGFILQLAWNLGPYLPYIIFGDDDDEKEKMWDDAITHAMFGSVEGFTGGDVMSSFGNMAVGGEWSYNQLSKDMPIASDINNLLNKFESGKNSEAINDIIHLVVQSGIGMNPQSITDAVVAIMDACGNDAELSLEAAIFIMRVLQVPQSQLERLYFDEVGLSGDEASKLTWCNKIWD